MKNYLKVPSRRFFWCVTSGLLGLTSAASYGAPGKKINLCNQSDQKIYLAVAYEPETGAGLMARGWWNADPQTCAELELPIATDRILVYADSENSVLVWRGGVNLCVDTTNKFDFTGAAAMSCSTGTLEQRGFKEFSLAAISGESGGQVPSINFRMEDADRLGSALRICNDTTENSYLAYAQKKSNTATLGVMGWYKIDPGKCYEAMRRNDADELYLYVNSEGEKKAWRGEVPLCTNQYEAFDFEDAATKACTGNNERLHLFKKIQMGAPGDFEYHLKDQDAARPRSLVGLCNTRAEKIVVAVAYESPEFGGQYISSGWYTIEPQKCSEQFAIHTNTLKVRVENEAGDVLRAGTFMACINGKEAFEFGNSTAMTCTDQGQAVESFDVITIGAGATSINLP